MEYLWLPHQIRFAESGPTQHDILQRSPGKQLSILWVPVILLIAVLCIPLPFPTGLPLIALALSLLLNQSRRARVFYVQTKRKLTPGSRFYLWFDKVDWLLRVKRRRAGRDRTMPDQ